MPFIAAAFADDVTGELLQATGGCCDQVRVGALSDGATDGAMATDYGITCACCPSHDAPKSCT